MAENLGNPSLADGVEDAWGFEVDGMTIVAREREDRAVFTLEGDMGAPPPEGRAAEGLRLLHPLIVRYGRSIRP